MAAQTAAQRLTALEDGMAAILAAVQGNAPTTDDAEPAPTPKDKVAATEARSDAVKRNLDPEVFESVPVGDSAVIVSVVPQSVHRDGTANVFYRGSRLATTVDGSVEKSCNREVIRALFAIGEDALIAAMDDVDKRAKLGEHRPAKAATTEPAKAPRPTRRTRATA